MHNIFMIQILIVAYVTNFLKPINLISHSSFYNLISLILTNNLAKQYCTVQLVSRNILVFFFTYKNNQAYSRIYTFYIIILVNY
jgi:hypothetical protein